ncbi:helix-turn-helix transcriptional regulator [Ruminococcaceae bacterium OttesenSCG-928-A16]|nr:helix-turn-helix transcriptional regulator [Ruminococcaceae bacterium OttesenSCG-928-A16]
MIVYQKLLDLLQAQGYTSYKIRQEGLISQSALTRLKKGTGSVDASTINKLCKKFGVQPGDLMEYVPDDTVED